MPVLFWPAICMFSVAMLPLAFLLRETFLLVFFYD
ncbi:hypothetical protein [Sicyoidochytrium minutum DNA virus]|nr:hypothetical protein [Sicyoidochytrium minutum DNA virus]